MRNNNIVYKLIAFVLATILCFSAVACNFYGKNKETSEIPSEEENIVVNSIEVNDAFVPLTVKGIDEESIDIETIKIDVQEILVNSIYVKDIEAIEVEVVPINDEMIQLVRKNYIDLYGDDIDLKKLFIDIGITVGVVAVICVTVILTEGTSVPILGVIAASAVEAAKSVGTVAGAAQLLTPLVIGTALDAAVSGYSAYEEGGDFSYIAGHMLNGVVDGIKWNAIMLPLELAGSGLKSVRAINKIRKLPGLDKLTDEEAEIAIKNLSKILTESDDDVAKSLGLSADTVKSIIKNKSEIISIVNKYNPLGVSSELTKSLKKDFFKRASLTDDAGAELIKGIKNGTIKNISDIKSTAAKKYIKENLYEFCSLFGKSLSNDFLDDSIRVTAGSKAYKVIKSSITSEKLFVELVKATSLKDAKNLISDDAFLILLQLRYGQKNVVRLQAAAEVYLHICKDNNVDNDKIAVIIEKFFNGSMDSLDDADIPAQVKTNIISSRDALALIAKEQGRDAALKGFLDDLAAEGLYTAEEFRANGGSLDCAKDIIKNSLSKADIEKKYGKEIYQVLVNNYNNSISCLCMKKDVNTELIEILTKDALESKGIQNEVIENILKGRSIADWGIPDEDVNKIGNIVADYYKIKKQGLYVNYNQELAAVRGNLVDSFVKNNNITIKNSDYAGSIMEPAGDNAAFIKSKYGDIYMSKQGFVILDDYAIARVEITDLTGDDAADIAKANLLHHGTQISIPGYTWHHLEDGKTLILVPTDLHEAYRHTGGAALIRAGLKGAV